MNDKSSLDPLSQQAEDPLIQRIRQRDVDALGEYIAAHHDSLFRFVKSITGEHLLALVEVDDLIQEIATASISGLPTAPLDQYSVMQWLQQLARRRVVDAHRFHFDAKRRDAGRQQSIHGGGISGGDSEAMGMEQLLAASMTSPSAVVSQNIRLNAMSRAIGLLGTKGLSINDPTKTYSVKSLDGQFTGLQLVSIVFTAFEQFAPGTNVGVDFSKEYQIAADQLGKGWQC